MTVREIAHFDVQACGPEADLATAAKIMWDCDCGVVPVINEHQRVVGIVTDRDICIAAATRGMRPSDVRVRDLMTRDVACCYAGDGVEVALNTMRERRVRRLPVVDGDGRLMGIISINDLALHAGYRATADVSGEALLTAFKAICSHTTDVVAV